MCVCVGTIGVELTTWCCDSAIVGAYSTYTSHTESNQKQNTQRAIHPPYSKLFLICQIYFYYHSSYGEYGCLSAPYVAHCVLCVCAVRSLHTHVRACILHYIRSITQYFPYHIGRGLRLCVHTAPIHTERASKYTHTLDNNRPHRHPNKPLSVC